MRGAHVGRDLLPYARREQQKGRADLAQIGHHSRLFLREVDLHPSDQVPADRVHLLHHPGERQHRDIFVVRVLGIGLEIGGGVTEERSMRPLGELGVRGRAGGRAQDGDIVGARRRQHALVASGITVEHRLAGCLELGDDHEARVVVFPHAARVEIDDPFDGRNASAEVEELVDLLLVLRDHDFRRSVIAEIGNLVLQRVAIDAEAASAAGVCGDLPPDPGRAVVADQHDDVAGGDPETGKADRHAAHMILDGSPSIGRPDTEFLLALGDQVGGLPGVAREHARRGVVQRDLGRGT